MSNWILLIVCGVLFSVSLALLIHATMLTLIAVFDSKRELLSLILLSHLVSGGLAATGVVSINQFYSEKAFGAPVVLMNGMLSYRSDPGEVRFSKVDFRRLVNISGFYLISFSCLSALVVLGISNSGRTNSVASANDLSLEST